MNQTAIYSKTGKGVQEASGKTSFLSRADRAVLAAIDGKTTVGELNIKFDKIQQAKFFSLIEKLDRDGFIREASPGVASRSQGAASRPAARPAAKPAAPSSNSIPSGPASDLDFTQILPTVSASKPPVDLAAKARAEAERKAQEDSLGYKAREQAETKTKAEAEARARAAAAKARAEAEAQAKTEAQAKAEAEARARKQAEEPAKAPAKSEADQEKVKEDIERAAREAMERARKEAEEKASREAEALRIQIEQERRAREQAESRHREEEARKRKEEEERRAREEAERRRKEEAERKRREEEERKRKEEAERRAREEAERRRKEEEERKRREEEEERKRKEEAERRAREEAERRRQEEEERQRREEQEQRRQREEAMRKAREDADRRRDEEDRKRREETARALREEQEVRAPREEQPQAAGGSDSFSESLLADLESFSQRDEAERRTREEAERGARERVAREAEARRLREEQERAREAQLISIPPGGGEAASQGRAKRRLAAIVAADVVGYSRMMGQDEEGTLARLRGVLNEIVRPMVSEHGGHIVKTVGDGLLIEFASVVAAMRWAVEAQEAVAEAQTSVARDHQIVFRMGINLGDIISDDDDVFGDGVNVASRLEGLADNGGICISSTVYDQVRDKVPYKFQDLGNQRFKNISRPVRVYRLKDEREAERARGPVLQDAAAMPSATAKLRREEDFDEVEVSDDDLRMDEVKRDEQAMTKEARKAARERAKEEKRRLKEEKKRLKAEQEPIKPIKIRRPRKWGRTIAQTLILVVVGAVAAVHFAPVPKADYEKAASAAFGVPVKIRGARMSLVRGLEIIFDGVTVGSGVRIAKVHAYPDIGTLLGDKKSFRSIELDGAVLRQQDLGGLLFGNMNTGVLKVERIAATKLRVTGPLSLPALEAEARFGDNGRLRSITLEGPDRLLATLTPGRSGLALELNATTFALPFAPDVSLSSFTMKGRATREGLNLTEWDGNVLDGTLSGTALIRWGPVWTVEGKLKVHRVNAAVFAPALLSEGKIEDGEGSYRMSGPTPAKLMDGAHIEGRFGMSKGVLGSFDLSRAIQTGGSQTTGRTIFAELTAEGVYDKGVVMLRNVNISAGALNAAASVDIAPGGALSARIVADMRTPGQTLRQTLNIVGTVKEPMIKEYRR